MAVSVDDLPADYGVREGGCRGGGPYANEAAPFAAAETSGFAPTTTPTTPRVYTGRDKGDDPGIKAGGEEGAG